MTSLLEIDCNKADGYAATLLGQWFKVPLTITLHGMEVSLSKMPERKKRMLTAFKRA
jgi:hypothetical protein